MNGKFLEHLRQTSAFQESVFNCIPRVNPFVLWGKPLALKFFQSAQRTNPIISRLKRCFAWGYSLPSLETSSKAIYTCHMIPTGCTAEPALDCKRIKTFLQIELNFVSFFVSCNYVVGREKQFRRGLNLVV